MRLVYCKACHISGAEAPEELRVLSIRRDAFGELLTRIECAKCGHQWETGRKERDLLHLPGYRDAAKHIEEPAAIVPRVWR